MRLRIVLPKVNPEALEVGLGFVQKSLRAYKSSHIWLTKPSRKCHKSGLIISFMHLFCEFLLLRMQPPLACEAAL